MSQKKVADNSSLLSKWLVNEGQPMMVNLNQMTVRGVYRTVTEEGKATIKANIIAQGNGDFNKGLQRTEAFLLQELPKDEKTKPKGKTKEYRILGGNHRFEVFAEMGIKEWPSYILAATLNDEKMTAAETEQLAGMDNGKSQYGVAKAGWFEYFDKLNRYLQFPGVVAGSGKRKKVDWNQIYQLSGNHEGLSENTAKKLYSARSHMLVKYDNLEKNPLWSRLLAIHKEFGYSNPIKLKMFTEEKRFWALDTFQQVEAINLFIDCIKQNKCKGTFSDWGELLDTVERRRVLGELLRKKDPHADLLDDYVECIDRGELPWLEQAFAKDGAESSVVKHVLAALNKSMKPTALTGPTNQPTVAKSPLAKKPATKADEHTMEVDEGVDDGQDLFAEDNDSKPELDSNTNQTIAEKPVLESNNNTNKPAPEPEDTPAQTEETEKTAKKTAKSTKKTTAKASKSEGKSSPVGSPDKKETKQTQETPPWKESMITSLSSHFNAHYSVVPEFGPVIVPQKASLIFYSCTGKIPNSHWNFLMRSVLHNGRIAIRTSLRGLS